MYLPYQHNNLNSNPQTEIGHFSLHALILIYTHVEMIEFIALSAKLAGHTSFDL